MKTFLSHISVVVS